MRRYGEAKSRGPSPRLNVALASMLALLGALATPASVGATVTEYPLAPGSHPTGITLGPDNALWFTEENANKIGRITTAGAINEYQIPTPFSTPAEITTGPDGALWFTEYAANKIGRLEGGTITEYTIPSPSTGPDGITAGPDGAVWFSETAGDRIGRITMDRKITEYGPTQPGPGDITVGPDGRLWFTESEAGRVGAISVENKTITEYELPLGADPSGIVNFNGALWFTQAAARKIGRITITGDISGFDVPGLDPSGIAVGPDGALWFTETGTHKIGRMTPNGDVTEFEVPTQFAGPDSIVAGPDGALWFTEAFGNKIGRIEPAPPPSPPAPPAGPAPQTAPTKTGCRVPKLRGLTTRRAKKKLRRASCRFRIRGKGRVVSTRPRAGVRTTSMVRVRAKPRHRKR